MGMPEEMIDEVRRRLAPPAAVGTVWRQNAQSVAAFLAASTQWRCAHGARGLVFLGLDYAGARIGITERGIEVTPALWADLGIMEVAARDALNGIKG